MRFVPFLSHCKGSLPATLALLTCVTLCVSACTTSKAIRTPVPDSPSVEQARNNLETQKRIRWGGDIISVENKADYTLIEIVDRPLSRNGTPKSTNQSDGRFFARTKEFIDPENVGKSQSITVSGTLVDYTKGLIGEHEYLYPVIEINEYKIWPYKSQRYPRSYYYPYWYDDPYWGPYPYWYGGFRYSHRYRHW